MTMPIAAIAGLIRREVIAYLFAGVALRWIWCHGLDAWGVALVLAALHLHPGNTNNAPSAEI